MRGRRARAAPARAAPFSSSLTWTSIITASVAAAVTLVVVLAAFALPRDAAALRSAARDGDVVRASALLPPSSHAAETGGAGAEAPAGVRRAATPPRPGCTRRFRGEADPADAAAWAVDEMHGHRVRLAHAIASHHCLKYVAPAGEVDAAAHPAGVTLTERVRSWSTAVWVATALRPRLTIAYAHKCVGCETAVPDADALLGLTLGELPKDAAALQRSLIWPFPVTLEPLDSARTARVVAGAALASQWALRAGNADDCNVLYHPAPAQTTTDALASARGAAVWKAAAAAGVRESAGEVDPPRGAWAWQSDAVHVVVHAGDGDAAGVSAALTDAVLPALARAQLGARVDVHVFADAGARASSFPAAPPGSRFYDDATPSESLLALLRADVIVGGAGSSIAEAAALFASRPLAVLLRGGRGDDEHPCPPGAVCCADAAPCSSAPAVVAALERTASRLSADAACGLLDDDSWVDALPSAERLGLSIAAAGTPAADAPSATAAELSAALADARTELAAWRATAALASASALSVTTPGRPEQRAVFRTKTPTPFVMMCNGGVRSAVTAAALPVCA